MYIIFLFVGNYMKTKDKNDMNTKHSGSCQNRKNSVNGGNKEAIMRKVRAVGGKIESFFNKDSVYLNLINLRNNKYPDGKEIIRRRPEIKEILNVFSKRHNRNVMLIGEPGTGRKQLIDGIVQSIKSGDCPSRLKNSLVFEVSAEQFIYEGDEIRKILKLVELAIRFPNTIFYISGIEKLIEANIIDAFELVFQYSICIGIMDNANMNFNLKKYHFEAINIDNPERKDLYALTRRKLDEIEKFHNNVKITKDSFDIILNESMVKTYDTKIGDILDIADEAAGISESLGMESVNIGAVLETNRHNIDAMFKRSESQNRFYAIHEAGHAIIALNYNVVINAISIIPKDDGVTGGFNIFEFDKNSLDSKDDILQNIEIALGGYVGTIVKGYPLAYGAISDLIEVNKIERAMFLYLGMESNKPISYLNDRGELELSYMSEKLKNELNYKVMLNIDRRLKKVNEILNEHIDMFDLLTHAIMKKGFLTKDEILSLYNGKMTLEEVPDIRTLLL